MPDALPLEGQVREQAAILVVRKELAFPTGTLTDNEIGALAPVRFEPDPPVAALGAEGAACSGSR